MKDQKVACVIQIKMGALLTKNDYKIVYNFVICTTLQRRITEHMKIY